MVTGLGYEPPTSVYDRRGSHLAGSSESDALVSDIENL